LCADGVAAVTSLLTGLPAVNRIGEQLHGLADDGQHAAPAAALRHMRCFVALGATVVVAPLACMALRPRTYARHRKHLCLANRLFRIGFQAYAALTPAQGSLLGAVVVTRAFARPHQPARALLLLLLHPSVYWLQQALYLLEWQLTLLFQACSTLLALRFWAGVPCFLGRLVSSEQVAAAAGAAERACGLLQSAAALVWAGAAVGGTQLGDGAAAADMCQGTAAITTLHVFVTLCVLLLLPVGGAYELERWSRSRQQQQRQQQQQPVEASLPAEQPGSGAAGSSRSGGSSSGWAGGGGGASSSAAQCSHSSHSSHSSSRDGRLQQGSSVPGLEHPTAAQRASGSDAGPGRPAAVGRLPGITPVWSHTCLLACAAPVVLSCTWLLSEALALAMRQRVQCPVPLDP
jgi:hypothetical protein